MDNSSIEVIVSEVSSDNVEEKPTNAKALFLDKVATILVGVAAIFSPIFFFPSTSFPFQGTKILFFTLLTAISFAFWAAGRLMEGKVSWPVHRIYMVIGIALLVSFVSAMFSGSFRSS